MGFVGSGRGRLDSSEWYEELGRYSDRASTNYTLSASVYSSDEREAHSRPCLNHVRV